jgi:hypothetical protein
LGGEGVSIEERGNSEIEGEGARAAPDFQRGKRIRKPGKQEGG